MSKELKESAEEVALDWGFSSLQETIRLVLHKIVKRELRVSVTEEKVVKMSAKNEKRYLKIVEDIKKGKGIVYTKDPIDFLRKLRS